MLEFPFFTSTFRFLCFLAQFVLNNPNSHNPKFMKFTYFFPELEVVLYSRVINNVVMVIGGFFDAE